MKSYTWRRYHDQAPQAPLGHVADYDYCAAMERVGILVFVLISAVITAALFDIFAHDELGIAIDTIRTDALASAGCIGLVMGFGAILKRNR